MHKGEDESEATRNKCHHKNTHDSQWHFQDLQQEGPGGLPTRCMMSVCMRNSFNHTHVHMALPPPRVVCTYAAYVRARPSGHEPIEAS